jgi:Fur family ferric uptake transcriptional regulator
VNGFGWRRRFRGGGYRVTLPREAVLSVLSSTDEHLSARDIFMRVQQACPSCGLNTVYRTLELLVGLGLVARLDFGDGQARYELGREHAHKSHHHHLVCVRCRRIIDYTDFIKDEIELIGKTEKGLSEKFGFRIMDHEIVFKGVCAQCQRQG